MTVNETGRSSDRIFEQPEEGIRPIARLAIGLGLALAAAIALAFIVI